MSSHHHNPHSRLAPAARLLIERIHRAGRPPMEAMTPAQAREFYNIGGPLLDLQPPPHVDGVQDLQVPMRDGHPAAARLYAPRSDAPLPVLLYLHGGGFTVGSLATHDVLCRQLSRQGHCAVLSLAYRLAPEHRFPTALHDAWDALNWLHTQGELLGLDTTRIAIGGDSAGGTLSAVCALMARDAGLPLALQLLFYPGCTGRCDLPSHHTYGKGFLLDVSTIEWFFGHYIDDAEREDWRFAPINAPDHSGVAPAWIGLAECDPLVDGGLRYADTLRMAGVPVELEVYRGMVHGFVTMARALPDALTAHADAGRALQHAFGLRGSP
jgi:acetyl esterase